MVKPATVEEYLATLAGDRRARLEELRNTIRTAAPDAVELISYNMPAYRVGGRMLISFSAFAHHDSVFPASRVVLDALGDEVAPFLAGKATLRFPANAPLPLELIARVVRVRRDEVAAGSGDLA
jgi:uncharacterized protein YdhG (YjbR/CyaY superfamily)